MVPSLTRQIRQVREMTVFFLRSKESGGPPSLASSVSSVPKGRAPQGERPERTSLPPHAEAGMPEAAPPYFVPSGQESSEALRNLRRGAGFLRRRRNIRRPHRRAPPLRPRAESADRFRCQFSSLEFFSFVGHGDHCRPRGEKVSEADGVPAGGSAFFARAEEEPPRFTTPSAESCLSRQPRKGTTSCPFSGRASRFSPRGKHESGALDGGPGFRPEQERR